MMVKKYGALALLLLLGACNFPTRQALNEATLAVSVIQTQVAQSPVQTMTASALQTQGANPQQTMPSVVGTLPPQPTQLPTVGTVMPLTQAPALGGVIPQPAISSQGETATPHIPQTGAVTVTVSVATNCRTGPARSYALLGVLNPGDQAVVVGKNEALDYWIIQNPTAPGTCWLWGYYATVNGNIASIPEVPGPPDP